MQQSTENKRRPSRRGVCKREKLRNYYKVYVKTDTKGGLFYKLLEVVKAVTPPKEEYHLHENKYGDRWEEYIDVYESKAEYKENVKIMKKNGGVPLCD